MCTSILPVIVERLYRAGHADEAADILKRILWWGERLPYYADSQVANFIDYRHDSPLQNMIGALTGAQCVIYGMFGVKVGIDGSVVVNPHPPAFSPRIALKGLRIRGTGMDVSVSGKKYTVSIGRRVLRANVGTPVTF